MFETDIDILCPSQSTLTTNDNSSIDNAIKLQTSLAQHHLQKLLLALNVRASLLVNAERLDLARNDAIAMTNLAPSSPLGYLCGGGIHSLRLNYASAIRTYDNGLKRVSRSHPQYDRLLHARATAFEKYDTRVDFISKLPLDIVTHNIIPRLLQGRRLVEIEFACQYFYVSRTWRQRLALASGLHYEIGPVALSAVGFERVQDLAPFMRSLAVIQPMREILSKITKRRLRRFNMLNKLRVVESISRGPTLLLSSLRSLSNTLTDLDLEYGRYLPAKKPYRLCDILDACPNLLSIRISCGDIDMSSTSKTYPKIIKLEVWNRDAEVTQDNILSLFGPFPNLRYLKLYPPLGSFMLPVIDQHCPLLQQLILTGRTPDFYDVDDMPEGNTGLRLLSVPTSDFDDGFKEDEMVQYLIKHSETLEAFGIVASSRFSEPRTLLQDATSQQVTFKVLRQINYLHDSEESLISFLLWMIQHAPCLESVETISGIDQAPIMEELTRSNHKHLKRLGMKASLFPADVEEGFMQHHVNLGQQSNLTELKIEIPIEFKYDSWIALVPRLTQLTTIEFCTSRMYGFKSLDSLMPQLANGCPALEKLIMSSEMEPMRFSDLYPMDRHRNLKHIIIKCEDIYGGGTTFRERFTNIESLHLSALRYSSADIDSLEKASFKFVFTEILSDAPYFVNDLEGRLW
ncbi:hypothetical protein O0I10_006320 [Lichtheimia ornata]|uniref:Uncharacterized protein n=1 Tax=Lichtheimia ornata TaxID=688661 RepID=A0AAD7V3B4_9FUNG|nr:uncharacterized protein O0I10_006320 [Lichtheimia ornata]KAJ8658049.1 hypothetical protein O0I10_006320 [Lichtheimia ornata]